MNATAPPLRGCSNLKLRQLLRGVSRHYDLELAAYDACDAAPKAGSEYGIVAAIPMGYPAGKFGPVTRQDPEGVTYIDRWGVT